MMDFIQSAASLLRILLEIGLLWVFYYWLPIFFRGTIAIQVLRGVVVLALVFLVARLLHLEVISWLFARIVAVVTVAFIVIFHPELRRGLARIGGETLLKLSPRREEVIEEVLKGILALSRRRIGAILAIERQTSLRSFGESGIALDAVISSELLQAIFMPTAPLHDGGIIISSGRLVAAACLFPLSENPRLSKTLGTRHRAALGLSEETDAVVIVVSEETGTISLAVKGELRRELEREQLAQVLYGATDSHSAQSATSLATSSS